MSIDFGWWSKDPDEGKFQISVRIHGGNITWQRKRGHHASWETYGPPNEDDWDKLMSEAERRVPRRLMSPKQFDELKQLRERSLGLDTKERDRQARSKNGAKL